MDSPWPFRTAPVNPSPLPGRRHSMTIPPSSQDASLPSASTRTTQSPLQGSPPLLEAVYDDPAFLAGYASQIPDEPAHASRPVAKSPSPSESVPDDSMAELGYPDTPGTPATSPTTIISSAPTVTHSTEPSNASISGRKTRAADEVCLVTGLSRLLTRSWTRPDPTAASHARRPLHAVRGLLIVCDG